MPRHWLHTLLNADFTNGDDTMLKFTTDHEWLQVAGTIATIGITDHAQNQLGDIVFAELPKIGQHVVAGEAIAVVESVKAASDVYAPVSGEIIDVNQKITAQTDLINSDPMGEGWFFKIKLSDPAQLNPLMDDAAYKTLVG